MPRTNRPWDACNIAQFHSSNHYAGGSAAHGATRPGTGPKKQANLIASRSPCGDEATSPAGGLFRPSGTEPKAGCRVSMLRNSAKANFTLDELGWSLHPPCDVKEWDGLLGWFIDQANADRTVPDDPYLRRWFSAAVTPTDI